MAETEQTTKAKSKLSQELEVARENLRQTKMGTRPKALPFGAISPFSGEEGGHRGYGNISFFSRTKK